MHARWIAILATMTTLLALAVLTSAGARSASDWVSVAHPAFEGGGSVAYVGGVLAPSPRRPAAG